MDGKTDGSKHDLTLSRRAVVVMVHGGDGWEDVLERVGPIATSHAEALQNPFQGNT